MKNVFEKFLAAAVVLVIGGLFVSFAYYQITGHRIDDPTGEKLAAVKSDRQVEQSASDQTSKQGPSIDEILSRSVSVALDSYHSPLVKFDAVTYKNSGDGNIMVDVSLNASYGLYKDNTISSYNKVAAHVFKEIYSSDLPVSNCSISFNVPLLNSQTGDEHIEMAYGIAMSREKASLINWNNIDDIDITQSANHPYMHPSLRNLK